MKNKIMIVFFLIIFMIGIVKAGTIVTPHFFYGTVTVGGSNAPAEAIIRARIGGADAGSITLTVAGKYGGSGAMSETSLAVNGSENGQTITFSISHSSCSGTNTITDTFESGAFEEKNLAFAGSCVGEPGPGGGGEGEGAAAPSGEGEGAPAPTVTKVTDPGIISDLKDSLPADWVDRSLVYYQEGASKTSTTKMTVGLITAALTQATDTEAIAALQKLKAALEAAEVKAIDVTRTLTVYRIQDKITGEVLYRTIIKTVFTAPNDMEDVEIIEVIPKTVAASTDDLVFPNEKPVILQKDPIIQWIIGEIKKGETKEFIYVVKKKLTADESTTLAGGKTVVVPPECTTDADCPEGKVCKDGKCVEKVVPVKPPIKPPVYLGWIIVAAIVIIGLAIYLVAIRKKKK